MHVHSVASVLYQYKKGYIGLVRFVIVEAVSGLDNGNKWFRQAVHSVACQKKKKRIYQIFCLSS